MRNRTESDFESFTNHLEESLVKGIEKLVLITGLGIMWSCKKASELYQERVLKRPVLRILTRKMLESRKTTKDSFAIGYVTGKRSKLFFKELNTKKHTGIFGTTGSGKSILIRQNQNYALLSGRSIINFDPKPCHENIEAFIALCQKYGKKFYIVSEGYDDFSIFNPLIEGKDYEIQDRIMNALTWSESFYKGEAERALSYAISKITVLNQEKVTIQKLLTVLEQSPNKKNIAGLISQLSSIQNSGFSKFITGDESTSLTFQKIRDEGACVYIGIPSLGAGSAGNALNKLFFGGLLYHCQESYMCYHLDRLTPMSIFFDELSSTIHEGFGYLQDKCRGAKMEITYATQCPSDIEKLGENLAASILENTGNFFIFNQVHPKHTELFAKLCGTMLSTKKTYATEGGERSARGSERETEEFLAHANIFRNLRVGQCVFLQRIPKRLDILNVRYEKPSVSPQRFANRKQLNSAF